MLTFEYDPQKSEQNQIKHGVDFEAAQALWSDPDLLTLSIKDTDESRFFSHRHTQ